jgi:predicted naringenin-chalcone synthase
VGFMGCHGALNALRVARAFCLADRRATALVCCTELCSLHFQYNAAPQAIVSNSLFADGAGAVVVRAAEAHDDVRPWRLATHGSTVLPQTADAMSWKIGNHGFEMYLSPQVPELIHEHLQPWLDAWLAEQRVRRSDIRSWATTRRAKILHACRALELPAGALDASWHVLSTYGNMSSPTVLFILDELQRRGAELPAVVLGFGPGLTVEAALLT